MDIYCWCRGGTGTIGDHCIDGSFVLWQGENARNEFIRINDRLSTVSTPPQSKKSAYAMVSIGDDIMAGLMERFTVVESVLVPLDRGNVDTDQIIPKQFLRSIERTGFGQFLFDEWRYLDAGELGMDCSLRPQNSEFPLNESRYQKAQVLLTRDNFGCGSSREHAVWALMEYGFRAIIAPSFGGIFANNAAKNGLLTIALSSVIVDHLFARTAQQNHRLKVDLSTQIITLLEGGDQWSFDILPEVKKRLLQGLDDIDQTLQHIADIKTYEEQRARQEPWLFSEKKI